MFWNILLFVGFTILSELLRPKPKMDVPDPSSIGDFQLPTAQEGRPVPVVWGTCMIRAPNVIWYGGLQVVPILDTVKSGFFSKQTVIRGYNYHLTIHCALCHGPLGVSGSEGLLTLDNFEVRFDDRAAPAVLNDQLPIHATPEARAFGETIVLPSSRAEAQYFFLNDLFMFGGPDKEGGIQLDCLLYPGGFWNGPSAILQSHLGANISSYRGIAHAVLRGYVGNSSYVKPVAFIVPRCPSPKLFLDGDTAADDNAVIGLDANPAYIILETLTDTEWGLGIPPALIDVDSFYTVAATLKTEELGMSYMLEQPTEAASIISDVLRHIDAVLYTDPATGLITLVLVRQDYDVEDLPVFDKSNIATCDMSRGSWSETKNSVKVIYIEGGLTESFDDTIMLVRFNGTEGQTTATDETGNATDPIQFNGNAHIDADNPILGGPALYLDGSGDSVGISWPVHQEFWTSNGVQTIEFKFRPDGAYPSIVAHLFALLHNVCTGDFGLLFSVTRNDHPFPNLLVAEWKTAAGCASPDSLAVPFINDGEVHTVRLSFDGTTMSLSLDAGQEVDSKATTTISGFSPGFVIGKNPALDIEFFKGWVKEFRITGGRARPAVYTFPTSEFPYPEINVTGRGSFEERAVQQQNLANIEARGGELAQEVIRFLGLSNSANANKVAARVLKTLSYPLATFKIVANRDAWALRPGSVFRLTWEPLGITDMACRVTRIGYGELLNGRIEIDAAEDVFGLAATAFSPPPATEWVNEVADAEPALAEMLLEMPYHFISSDDRYVAALAVRDSLLDLGYNIWSDRDGDTDPEFLLTASTQPFTPSGLLVDEYEKCTDALDAIGFSLMTGRDLDILESVTATQRDAGENIALITSVNGNEFIAWQTVTSNEDGDTATLTNIVRGILDTVPLAHPAGSRVWFFTNGFGVVDEDDPYPNDRTIYAKLLPFNARGTLAIGAAETLEVTLASRAERPYPPGNVKVNGDPCPTFLVETDAVLTWSHRHRVLQTDDQVIVHQDAGDYTAEPEGDYRVEIYVGGTLHHTFEDFALSSDGYQVEYTFAQRQLDDTDMSLPVTFVITPVNDDDLTGTPRSIEFTMVFAVEADFSGTPLFGASVLSVAFTDLSAGLPDEWLWEKNDGSGWVPFSGTPSAQNPTENFSEGTWSVRLTAANPGDSDTETKTGYIVAESASARGVWGGGTTGSNSNVIDYIEFDTGGTGTDFGDLTVTRRLIASAASSTRGLWAGGFTTVNVNVIDYVTIASPGNATDFGDLSVTRRNLAGLSSSTRACFGGGFAAAGSNVIDYVTIASAGNATDFGDLTQARWRISGAASTTRGVYAGGTTTDASDATAAVNTIDYITIASTGNATDFGDLTVSRRELSGGASPTRAVFSGGHFWNGSAMAASNTIDYVTIASAGNATDFGDLTVGSIGTMTAASQLSALIAQGSTSGVVTTVDKVTIASTGNATDFADLTVARNVGAACSNGHGGL